MRSILLLAIPSAVVATLACTGDDVSYGPIDAAAHDAMPFDATMPPDAGAFDASDSSMRVPQHLLMTNSGTKGELVAVNTMTSMIDGRFSFASSFGGAAVGDQGAPYLLETVTDRIDRLDPASPWNIVSSWSVAGTDAFDGGNSYADPIQIIVTAPNKAYVLRYNRDAIAVIDPSQMADAGPATSYIDVKSLQQAGDNDGTVGMSSAVYEPVSKRLYVALSNLDLHNVDPQGFFQLCGTTISSLIAIDTTTDTVVSLGGMAPGGGIALSGRSPQLASYQGIAYDVVGNRVLILSTGCNQKLGDGGPGPLVGRLVEAVSLKDNSLKTLIDLATQQFPGEMIFINQHTAYLQLGFAPYAQVFAWDPTTAVLGAPLASAPDVFAYDAKTNSLIGPQTPLLSDGGTGPIQVVRVPLGDGGAQQVLLPASFTETGYLGNAALFPPK